MKILTLEQIKNALDRLDPKPAVEAGFAAYSEGKAVVPPVAELLLEGGDVHIKYGYLKQDSYYVVKIASGFYGNPKIGLPSGNGLMLLFAQQTGALECVLLDEGYLTDVRTAVAGAIAAEYLAPSRVERIGIVGTGVQARMQLEHLAPVTACRDVLVWGRGDEQLRRYRSDMEAAGYDVETTRDAAAVLARCNLVVTATPAEEPLLFSGDLRPGTHITAVGSDTPAKQELDAAILRRADVVVADSVEQCRVRGEISKAVRAGQITMEKVVELGDVITGKSPGRAGDDQITVADLTGVAVQDIKIAAAVYESFCREEPS